MVDVLGLDILNYGVLGAWTAWLIYEKHSMLGKMQAALDAVRRSVDRQNTVTERLLRFLD